MLFAVGIKRPYGPSLGGGADALAGTSAAKRSFGSDDASGASVGCPACSLEFSSMEALQSHIAISHKHLSLGTASTSSASSSPKFGGSSGAAGGAMPPLPLPPSLLNQKPQYKCEICDQTFRTQCKRPLNDKVVRSLMTFSFCHSFLEPAQDELSQNFLDS